MIWASDTERRWSAVCCCCESVELRVAIFPLTVYLQAMLLTCVLHHIGQYYHAATRRHLEPHSRRWCQAASLRHLTHFGGFGHSDVPHSGIRDIRVDVSIEVFDLELVDSVDADTSVHRALWTFNWLASVGDYDYDHGIIGFRAASAVSFAFH